MEKKGSKCCCKSVMNPHSLPPFFFPCVRMMEVFFLSSFVWYPLLFSIFFRVLLLKNALKQFLATEFSGSSFSCIFDEEVLNTWRRRSYTKKASKSFKGRFEKQEEKCLRFFVARHFKLRFVRLYFYLRRCRAKWWMARAKERRIIAIGTGQKQMSADGRVEDSRSITA